MIGAFAGDHQPKPGRTSGSPADQASQRRLPCDEAVLAFGATRQHHSLSGQTHGRTIPDHFSVQRSRPLLLGKVDVLRPSDWRLIEWLLIE